MEDVSLFVEPATPEVRPAIRLIAPWWHTTAILLILLAWAILSGSQKRSYARTSHAATYISMMLMSWMLFGTTIAGVIDRNGFFFATLRNRAQSLLVDARRGLAIYVGIYLAAIVVATIVSTGTMAMEHHAPIQPAPSSSETDAEPATPLPPPPPAPEGPLNSFAKSHIHFDSKTMRAIAPQTPLDLLLWFAVSFTAGFCEEHIFRGYLLTQAIGFTRSTGMSRILSVIVSIAFTSLIFGSLHLYEGTGGALIITALGAVYSVLALKFGNLRAVIAAHFLQDFCAGIVFFLFHTRLAH